MKRGVSRLTIIAVILVVILAGIAAYIFLLTPPEEVKEIRIGIAGPLEYTRYWPPSWG